MTSALDDTFNPSALGITSSATPIGPGSGGFTATKQNGTAATPKQVNNKTAQTYPRIDFEPIYAELKAHIGHNWTIYYDALTRFVRGELSSGEFGYITDEFVYATPASEHAHNSLICAIIHNTGRDNPDLGPAPWVSATSDKITSTSSGKAATISSDASEQRLKTEIMALLPRDRKRLKGIISDNKLVDDDGSNMAGMAGTAAAKNSYEEYYNAGRIRAPEPAAATNPGTITRTNWELEIKKRYTQSLFAESLEFPDPSTIYARMVPICYEESVGSGTSMIAAELVATAAEVYLKDFLCNIYIRTRSNGPRYENGAGGGILTARYKKRVVKEEEEVKAGRLARNRDDDLLPVESEEAKTRKALCINDLKLASRTGPSPWNGMPLLGVQVSEAQMDFEYGEWKADHNDEDNGGDDDDNHNNATNGVRLENGGDDMDLDEDDYGWDGTTFGEREALGSLLDECLAVRA